MEGLGSRVCVLPWGEGRAGEGSLEALQSLRGCPWGPGTCTEGPSRDGTGTGIADGVAGPAGIQEGLVPGPPGCAEDRAFMGRGSAILPGYPAVGHVQACLLYGACQGHGAGTFFPRDLKFHSQVRL